MRMRWELRHERRGTMGHEIVKRGSKDFYCSVCHQSWTAPSKAKCPKLPVIAFSQRGALASQTELNHKGYRTGKGKMPAPVACYRSSDSNHSVIYIYLYDPSQFERKRESKRLKVLIYRETLDWPVSWLSAFEQAIEYRDMLDQKAQHAIENEPQQYRDPMWQSIARDIAERASSLVFFSQDELGETVTLSFPLTGIRRQWGDGWNRQEDMHTLVTRLERAYKEYKWKTRPRLTDEQLRELEARRHARDEERKALEAAARAKLFERVDWLVSDTTPNRTPAQTRMFEDIITGRKLLTGERS